MNPIREEILFELALEKLGPNAAHFSMSSAAMTQPCANGLKFCSPRTNRPARSRMLRTGPR